MKQLFVFVFVLFALVGSVSALEYTSYVEAVELTKSNSFHTVEIDIKTHNATDELRLLVPPRAKKLSVLLDGVELVCTVEDKEGQGIVLCNDVMLNGVHELEMRYESTYPLFDLNDYLLYKAKYRPVVPTYTFNYSVTLPKGYVIPDAADVSQFVNPTPEIDSDGQRISLHWNANKLQRNYEISVMIQPVHGKPNSIWLWLFLGFVLVVMAGGVWFVFKRKSHPVNSAEFAAKVNQSEDEKKLSTRDMKFTALVEHEQKIVEILKQAENQTLWQKQLQIESGFNKVKLSRVLRSLEERGVIKKEPWGNTNKISLNQ